MFKTFKITIITLFLIIFTINQAFTSPLENYDINQQNEVIFYCKDFMIRARKNWQVPAYLKDKARNVQIFVSLNQNGEIIEKRILKSSGNQGFDESAMNALDNLKPVPLPSFYKDNSIDLETTFDLSRTRVLHYILIKFYKLFKPDKVVEFQPNRNNQ